jgi:1-acyl-sn-glycerol-3-phosphate acyltransferase
MADDRLIQRSVTDEIMYELMRLSGQEYVDEYAAVVKLRLAGKGPDQTGEDQPGEDRRGA